MSLTSLWGFGGVKIEKREITALFEHAIGNVAYEAVYRQKNVIETLDREIINEIIGFRPVVTCTLVNVQDDDYIQFKHLFNIFTNAVSGDYGSSFTVYPRFDDSFDDNISITCILTPGQQISMKEVGKTQCPQTLTLSFTGVNLVPSIPTNTSTLNVPFWVDEGGDNIINQDGANLYFKE